MKKLLATALLFVAATAPLLSQTTITGRLVGADGRPMKAAHVSIQRPNDRDGQVTHVVGRDGRFSVVVAGRGLRLVHFTGVDHLMSEMAVYLSDAPQTVAVDVRLGTHSYYGSFDGVQVIGDFNDYSWESGVPMKRNPDGTYVAEIPTTRDSVYYQLLHVATDRSVNGTAGSRWIYDGGGDYEGAVAAKNGVATIVFEPSKLVRSDEPAALRFKDRDGVAARVDREYRELRAIVAESEKMMRETAEFREAAPTVGRRVMAKLDSLVAEHAAAHDAGVRALVAAEILAVVGSWPMYVPFDDDLAARLHSIPGLVPAESSELYSLDNSVANGVYPLIPENDRPRYLYGIVDRHYDPFVRTMAAAGVIPHLDQFTPVERARYLDVVDALQTSPSSELAASLRPPIAEAIKEIEDASLETGTITGAVRDSLGRPVPGVTVSVMRGNTLSLASRGRTNAAGEFKITTRKRGLLRVETTKGRDRWGTSIAFVGGPTLGIELTLVGTPDPMRPGEMIVKADESTVAGRVAARFTAVQEREGAVRRAWSAHAASGADRKSFRFDWTPYRAELASVDSAYQRESDPTVRQMLLLDYLDLATAMRDSSSRERTAAMRREAIAQIPPSSRLWSLDEQWLVNLMWGMTRDEGDASLLWPYLDRFEREQPDEQLRAEILYRTVEMGMQVNDAEAERRATAALATLGSKYPTSNGAQVALERFGGTSLRDGEMIPNFTFVSIDDPAVIYTRESMLGKTYLLDLWATWCGPCIGELPTLTSAYESYKPKGFEILSISFDASPDDVKAFRGKKWKMPWLHTFSPGGFSSSAARLFNVKGIPKTFLVGPDGRIIATDVRGEALASILAHTLAPERELPPGTQH